VTADALTARKELLGNYEPADGFEGARKGFVFKLGVRGLGYYEDASAAELEARSRAAADAERKAAQAERKAAAANPEEIELDMDDDEEDEEEAAPPSAASRVASNPEEIEVNFEDIETQDIPSGVFGGGLSSVRANLEEEVYEEPALLSNEPEKEKKTNALSKFQKVSKGKGKGSK
ncbi:unnamed protein product, partial [Polarella glacialis]